jgi:hypothetical protein
MKWEYVNRMRDYVPTYESRNPHYEYVDEYEALPPLKRARLLVAARALGALCAQDAYLRGLEHPYDWTEADDDAVEALEELLEQYGIPRVPGRYTDDEEHPIWYAFWRGVHDVPVPEPQE